MTASSCVQLRNRELKSHWISRSKRAIVASAAVYISRNVHCAFAATIFVLSTHVAVNKWNRRAWRSAIFLLFHQRSPQSSRAYRNDDRFAGNPRNPLVNSWRTFSVRTISRGHDRTLRKTQWQREKWNEQKYDTIRYQVTGYIYSSFYLRFFVERNRIKTRTRRARSSLGQGATLADSVYLSFADFHVAERLIKILALLPRNRTD